MKPGNRSWTVLKFRIAGNQVPIPPEPGKVLADERDMS